MKIWSKKQPPFLLNRDDPMEEHAGKAIFRIGAFAGVKLDYPTLPGFCEYCVVRTGKPRFTWLAWRRRNAMYPDDEQNWILSCKECHTEDTENFNEMWEDYYSSVL